MSAVFSGYLWLYWYYLPSVGKSVLLPVNVHLVVKTEYSVVYCRLLGSSSLVVPFSGNSLHCPRYCTYLIGTLQNHDDDGNGNVINKYFRFNAQNNNSARASCFFCIFLCLHCTTTTWNDQILSLLEKGNGKAINSTISVWTRARSPLFSRSQNPLLLNIMAKWDKGEKV